MTTTIYHLPKVYLITDGSLDYYDGGCPFEHCLKNTKQFDFGKYKDRIVREVFEVDAPYFEWCIINVPHFMVSQDNFKLLIQILENAPHNWDKSKIERLNLAYLTKGERILVELDKLDIIHYKREPEQEEEEDDDGEEYDYGGYSGCACEESPCRCSDKGY